MKPATPFDIYSVDQLTSEIRKLLEMSYADVWVEGEVSTLATPPSGHLYFTLKDQNSLLKCVLFKNRKYLCSCLPAEGQRLLVRGRASLYAARGDVQMICSYIEAAGEGELRRQFEALKAQLKEEGLFAEQHKQPIPEQPREIALITSPQGAVLHDIITTLKRRYPLLRLRLYPVTVQGDVARDEIITAINEAQRDAPDILVLARGGGSLEDLQVFNDEAVARAVFACPIPTISAIGHETDFVITDFVADQRAPTPTAAATMATPDINTLRVALTQFRIQLFRQIQARLNDLQQRLDLTAQGLKHPRDRLAIQNGVLQHLSLQLEASMQRTLGSKLRQLESLKPGILTGSPANRLQQHQYQLKNLSERLQQAASEQLNRLGTALMHYNATLQALSPGQTLARGYAIVQNREGHILRSTRNVALDDQLTVRLSQGKLGVRVEDKEDN